MQETTTKASATKGGNKKLRSATVEVADGGFTVTCHYEPNGKEDFMSYHGQKPKVFTSLERLQAFIGEAFGKAKK